MFLGPGDSYQAETSCPVCNSRFSALPLSYIISWCSQSTSLCAWYSHTCGYVPQPVRLSITCIIGTHIHVLPSIHVTYFQHVTTANDILHSRTTIVINCSANQTSPRLPSKCCQITRCYYIYAYIYVAIHALASMARCKMNKMLLVTSLSSADPLGAGII
jgi:hypothetical protein